MSNQHKDALNSRRAKRRRIGQRTGLDVSADEKLPIGVLAADPDKLGHIPAFEPKPRYYADYDFDCRQCGRREVWTAATQKTWFETHHGHAASRPKFCSSCRSLRRSIRERNRRRHVEGLIKKYGLQITAARLRIPMTKLEDLIRSWDQP